MKLVNIACNNCGAPLEVPVKTKYLTCSFCESRLEVQHSGNAYFTNVLEAVRDLKSDVVRLKLENEIDRLDRSWERERESLMLRDKHGRGSVPSKGHVVVGWSIVVIAGVFTLFAVASGHHLGWLGLVAVLFAWIHTMVVKRKHERYESSRLRFKRRRRELVAEMKQD